ncbi:hypothetical protein OCU04_002304 [Sclerotinia nivalis]|uniref:Uncharacterized protein n=1 Tax=Sclerotinia nivalis TaxID=352851 RepID=A0A9X0DM19_9HELO|nr:hypothetical protein OCU04_002304 [Sclerotinia nivalis]
MALDIPGAQPAMKVKLYTNYNPDIRPSFGTIFCPTTTLLPYAQVRRLYSGLGPLPA